MSNPVTVEIPRPFYRQDAELDCMSMLQYTIANVFGDTLSAEELRRIGEWFKSRCEDKAKGGA